MACFKDDDDPSAWDRLDVGESRVLCGLCCWTNALYTEFPSCAGCAGQVSLLCCAGDCCCKPQCGGFLFPGILCGWEGCTPCAARCSVCRLQHQCGPCLALSTLPFCLTSTEAPCVVSLLGYTCYPKRGCCMKLVDLHPKKFL
eukprot:CAMPEP_0206173414 /NCGR_PEP_ID=MMETSP1474-20131121/48808_1 /ASSEMBLY_ACC=CAM_ASM_001110 /TAXON_ID=97495 /ORGANISM="Imantonia sp., Strain RCC918" /LENGTH=142 /DNA_ID=CAMNT_0053582255 /DNA_START=27 /DNA_END=452 /DNA_ORIENTATION=+